jgi:hypothetical protein
MPPCAHPGSREPGEGPKISGAFGAHGATLSLVTPVDPLADGCD